MEPHAGPAPGPGRGRTPVARARPALLPSSKEQNKTRKARGAGPKLRTEEPGSGAGSQAGPYAPSLSLSRHCREEATEVAGPAGRSRGAPVPRPGPRHRHFQVPRCHGGVLVFPSHAQPRRLQPGVPSSPPSAHTRMHTHAHAHTPCPDSRASPPEPCTPSSAIGPPSCLTVPAALWPGLGDPRGRPGLCPGF